MKPGQIWTDAIIAVGQINTVMATLTANTFMSMGNSSGPMSRRVPESLGRRIERAAGQRRSSSSTLITTRSSGPEFSIVWSGVPME